MQDEGYKRCSQCGETKPAAEFYSNGPRLHGECKVCNRERSRRWRQANRDKQREQGRRKYAKQRVKNPTAQAERVARWRAEHPEETRALRNAHQQVLRAVRGGEIVRPDVCSDCGGPGPIEAHHPDHSKPLDVEWLCRICHRAADRRKHGSSRGSGDSASAVL